MKKIKIVQIGIGHDHAGGIIQTLNRLHDVFELVGYAVPPEEKGRFDHNLFFYEGVPEITMEEAFAIPDLDAMAIETEEMLSMKYAILAAEAGYHLHIDKPGNNVHGDFKHLVDIMKEKKLVLHMGYMYRYNPCVISAIEKAKSGALGTIYSVEAQMNCHHLPEKRQWLQGFPGGMLFYLGCHLIDLICTIQGEPKEIIPLNTCVGTEGVTAEDLGMAVFRYENGISFAKTSAIEPGGYQRRQLVICGNKGTVEIMPLEIPTDKGTTSRMSTVLAEDISDIMNWQDYRKTAEAEPYNRYHAMMEGFASFVRGEKENPYTYDYELMLHRVLLKACGQ